jgi:hypothetical protein
MGTRRQRQRQEELWYRRDLAEAPGHPFYQRLNEVLEKAGFDEFCEARCQKFYHEKLSETNPQLIYSTRGIDLVPSGGAARAD